MAKDPAETNYGSPEFKPKPAGNLVECAPQDHWDVTGLDKIAMLYDSGGFLYLDRVEPEMFVGRYNHGTCDAVPEGASKHYEHDTEYGVADDGRRRRDVRALADRNHAYIVSITPEGSESRCLYCGSTMDGYPGERKPKGVWDGPFERPRRATEKEMAELGVKLAGKDNELLYLDITWPVFTGRMRIGECPHGGTHEAVVCLWRYEGDVRQSFCMFCGERWDGPPPGFWEVLEPYNTVEATLEKHAEYMRKGWY